MDESGGRGRLAIPDGRANCGNCQDNCRETLLGIPPVAAESYVGY